MLRSDYKYSREPSIESGSGEKARGEDYAVSGLLGSSSKDSASGGSGGGGSGSRRSGSMKHWSPLAALGKRARDGLRRCNTVRAGLGWGGGGESAAAKDVNDVDEGGSGGVDRSRRNAMPNIFLGLPSSGVRRLFAVYGIDDTRGTGVGFGRGAKSASTSSTSAARGAEESLFARHTRTSSSVRSRPPSFTAGTGAMPYQQLLMQQQAQQQQLLQPHYHHHTQGQLDRRRASSMRDHGRHQRAMSSYGNR